MFDSLLQFFFFASVLQKSGLFPGDWYSVFFFHIFFSEPLGSKSPPKVYCDSTVIPPQSTVPPPDIRTLLTTSSTTEGSQAVDRKFKLSHSKSTIPTVWWLLFVFHGERCENVWCRDCRLVPPAPPTPKGSLFLQRQSQTFFEGFGLCHTCICVNKSYVPMNLDSSNLWLLLVSYPVIVPRHLAQYGWKLSLYPKCQVVWMQKVFFEQQLEFTLAEEGFM